MHAMNRLFRICLVLSLSILFAISLQAQSGAHFEVVVPAATHPSALTGRVYVVVSRMQQASLLDAFGSWRKQTPFFAQDVSGVAAGEPMTVDAQSAGYPYKSLRDLPAGDYYVQARVNPYTEMHRADGHTIWIHMHPWEQRHDAHPQGDLSSDVQFVHLDPTKEATIRLLATHESSPMATPADTPWVKHIEMQSKLLTKFWGRPIYIGANILLPAGYNEHPQQKYPVIYEQDHFTLNPPLSMRLPSPASPGSAAHEGDQTFQDWSGPHFARMIAVDFLHPTPYYDDSYAVNSENNGPYGDALIEELIPYIETHFRIIRAPWARVLTGGSTGGWESLAWQLYHPDFFGGTFTGYPDPIDFRHYQLINIYGDQNAFRAPHSPLIDRERPFQRDVVGQVDETERQQTQLEEALGSHGRSCQQLGAWNSVFNPVGSDGYPRPLWDPHTGDIDPAVVQYTREHNYDLREYLARNWTTLGPLLTGKLFLWAGDMDGYYLNLGVYDLEEFLVSHPEAKAHFEYGRPKIGHGWMPWSESELIRMMARHVADSAPAGTDLTGWYEK